MSSNAQHSTQQETEVNSAAGMDALIRSLGPNACWNAAEPLPQAEVDKLLAQLPVSRRTLPADLRALYRFAGEAYIGPNIMLLPLDEVISICEDAYAEFLDASMPSMFLFAVNDNNRAFLCDTDGVQGQEVGAVYICDQSALAPEECIWCAPSVTEFLRLTTARLTPWDDED